ncbi:MAG: FecR family protein [Opitutaceae bacterium]
MNQTRATIDATAAEWVTRRTSGLSDIDARRLADWLDSDPRHAEAFLRFARSWSALDRPRKTGTTEAFRRALAAAGRQRRRTQARVGACLALLAVATSVGWWQHRAGVAPTAASAAQVPVVVVPERHALPDGSILEHTSGARYRVAYSALERRIVLESGGGNFEVTHDPARPFVVEARGVGVRAVGTVFSVQIRLARITVLVTEGRVAVARNDTPAPLLLDAGQRAAVDPAAPASAAFESATATAEEIAAELDWRQPRVEFSRTPLLEVVKILNRHNRVQLTVEDATVAALPVSGRFRADDAEAFLSVLQAGFGVVAIEAGPARLRLHAAP